MRHGSDIQVFAFNFHTHTSLVAGKVACRDNQLLTIAKHYYGRLAETTSAIGYHLDAGGHKLAEVLIGIILSRIALLASLAVHLNQGVLCPSPG